MEANDEYTRMDVCGVPAIVWKHIAWQGKKDNEIKQNRKVLKDQVGIQNKDIPMLDKKQKKSDLVYCDIIIYTDDVSAWDRAIQTYYKDLKLSEKIIPGGRQIELCQCNTMESFVSVNFCQNTGKLMIQPRNFEECNILEFLKAIPSITYLRKEIVDYADDADIFPVISTTGKVATSRTCDASVHTARVADVCGSVSQTIPHQTLDHDMSTGVGDSDAESKSSDDDEFLDVPSTQSSNTCTDSLAEVSDACVGTETWNNGTMTDVVNQMS